MKALLGISAQKKSDRRWFIGDRKVDDRLRDIVIEDFEIVFREIEKDITVTIRDDDIEVHPFRNR